jgi:hypothetical protein
MKKILFLCLWYCAIYPAAFFMTSFALFINYFTDRFSLMRTWKRAPQLGTKISQFSRRYFFSLAIVAMAVVSSMFWAAYPFDNLCEGGRSRGIYIGDFNLTIGDDGKEVVNVSENDTIYVDCLQDLIVRGHGFSFPFIPSQQEGRNGEWMTDEQEEITTLFGWSSVAVCVVVFLKLVSGWVTALGETLFRSSQEVGLWHNLLKYLTELTLASPCFLL